MIIAERIKRTTAKYLYLAKNLSIAGNYFRSCKNKLFG
jgi:hypothetical protein